MDFFREGPCQLVSAVEKIFVFISIERGDAGRAGERVARVRVAVEKLYAATLTGGEGVVDRILDDHAAERHGARGDALRERDEVGLDAEMLRGERGAEAPPASDHLVEHEQDAVAGADLA